MEPISYPHIAARIFDTPLLIEPGKLQTICAAIGHRFNPGIDWGMVDPAHARSATRSDNGYMVMDGVAIIPVEGTLVHRGSSPDSFSGLTGYNKLSQWFRAAIDDSAVQSIMLDVDSPGGEVAGAFDFADEIYNARGIKPITAVAADLAASAGYLVASAADEVVVTRTGRVGSVGVVTAHANWQKAIDKAGVAITHIYAGDHKIDGNPYGPLPPEVRDRIQGEIDRLYSLFVSTVARNTGMTEDAVRATQALTYMGDAAVDIGFASRVSTREATFTALAGNNAAAGGGFFMSHQLSEKHMSDKQNPPAQATAASAGMTEADHQAAVATAVAAATTEATAKATAEATAAERGRIKSIITSESAASRADLASHLAFETDFSAAQAVAILDKAPAAQAAGNGGASATLATLMAAHGASGVTQQDASTQSTTQAADSNKSASILASYNKATGGAAAHHKE